MHRRTTSSNTARRISLSWKRPWRLTETLEWFGTSSRPRWQTQTAEPPAGQVEAFLLAQTPLRADREAVADQEHPDHQFRAIRRTARMAAVGRQLGEQPTQIENTINLPQQVIPRHHPSQIEGIEQTVLARWRAQHRPTPPKNRYRQRITTTTAPQPGISTFWAIGGRNLSQVSRQLAGRKRISVVWKRDPFSGSLRVGGRSHLDLIQHPQIRPLALA